MMAFRGGPRGERSADLPPLAFVAFLQNHDQVGNRAFGERIGALAQDEAVRAISAVYLLLPQVPMLFMGEEWNAREPFQYFCDFAGELADSVRNGRREEFAKFPEFADPAKRDRIPDPQSRRTFGAAKLAWADCERPGHAEWLNRYRRLLQIRHREIVPLLAGIRSGGSFEIFGPGAVAVRWKIDGGELTLAANLSATPAQLPAPSGRELWREGAIGDGGRCGPWTVRWAIDRTGDSPKPEPIDEHALDELAARCGIHREGSNAHGAMRRVSVQTLQRLLQGLGVPAADTGQIRSSLESLERESWQRAIGPVQVVYEQAPADLDVRLPRGTAGVQWRITLEDGSERTGSAAFHELELTATREIDGREYECRRVRLDPAPTGYHRLTIEPDGSTMSLIATPGRCWLPANADAAAQRPRLWGIAAQLYLVRSERNWGIGDFADLGELVRIVRERGGDVVGVNPLHALFADNPEHASPYSPASRLLLNVLNIAVPSMPEFGDSAAAQALVAAPDFQAAIEECREAKLVDYRRVADLKTRVLTVLFAEAPASEARWREFEQFRGSRDESFERHCVFLALRQHFARRNAEQADWRRWPEAFRDRRAAAVAEFTANHGEEITYVAWLQWIADRQLAAAAAQARGMRIGLYCDLAVGADPSGAETWSEPDLVAAGLHVGAPPDPMSEHGQDWGLPPINPHRLRARAYRPFIELLRANMRHAGALRIDHVMALQRLHCIPQGMAPTDGAYVDYPLEDLVGILALESHRHGCMIVGEDLGTVPSGFRARMAEANVLSYRVLFFERDASQSFLPPERYPQLALAVVGNHDLPTLRGWWEGRDIALREQLEQCGPQQIESQRRERERDQQALLAALRDTGVWPQAAVPSLAELATATHQLIARTPAKVAIAQLDDVGLEAEPVNVPSARDYPHWRRRLATSIEELAAHDRFRAIAEAFNAERGSA
jgi:4-alpha-glucanotransferase